MRKLIAFLVLILCCFTMQGQELNASVNINYGQLGNNHATYFSTLEKSLKDFINNTSWGTTKYSALERIDCVFIFNITSFANNVVNGSLQVQSTRTVFNSTYSTPVLNFNDKDISFTYIEFSPLEYNPNSSDSNLTNLIAFYANILIALDANTFKQNQGGAYFQNALGIVNTAQQSNYKGWKQGDGTNNRYYLATDLASNAYQEYMEGLYIYHRLGLDYMVENPQKGRDGVYRALLELNKVHTTKPNSFLMRIFFDAKSTEIKNLYSGISDPNKKKVVDLLKKLAPLNSSIWNSL